MNKELKLEIGRHVNVQHLLFSNHVNIWLKTFCGWFVRKGGLVGILKTQISNNSAEMDP